MPVREWREADGFRYVYIDFRGASEAEIIRSAQDSLSEDAGGPDLRVVCDVEGIHLNPRWAKAVKDANAAGTRRDVGGHVAVLNADKLIRAFLHAANFRAGTQRFAAFDDLAEAVAWLRSV